MTEERFLNLSGCVSSSVRLEGQTAHGSALWLKCGLSAWLIGMQWRSTVITVVGGHGGCRTVPFHHGTQLGTCQSGLRSFFLHEQSGGIGKPLLSVGLSFPICQQGSGLADVGARGQGLEFAGWNHQVHQLLKPQKLPSVRGQSCPRATALGDPRKYPCGPGAQLGLPRAPNGAGAESLSPHG